MIISIDAEKTLTKFKAFHDKNTQQNKNKGNYLRVVKPYVNIVLNGERLVAFPV